MTDQHFTEDEFAKFAADPMNGPKSVIPSEEAEGFARMLREQYVALVGQGFTEHQALRIISQVIESLIRGAQS